jgi:bifunctional oligoribonuclease and PAP phosphatase NrnA
MFECALPLLKECETFLVSGHINPDGDCVGSVCACAQLLQSLGKKVSIVCHDPVPENLHFLAVSWQLFSDLAERPQFDCMIILDTPQPERLGDVLQLFDQAKQSIVIDHHISNAEFGSVNVVASHVSSCGEMIFEMFTEMKVPISKASAQLLYVAISTDTGSFRFGNTTGRTHQIVADLIGTGIDHHYLNEQLYSYIRPERILLLKRFLNNVSFSESGAIVWSHLSESDLAECHADKADMDGFVNYLSDIRGIDIAFFAFSQAKDARIKVSFRAKGKADVNTLANQFGGGGHSQAAGCIFHGDIKTVSSMIIGSAERQRNEGMSC